MLAEKKLLDIETIEAQSAFELPDRVMPLVTVVVTDVLNNLTIDIDVRDNRIAVQVCAVVALLNGILVDSQLTCRIQH